MSSGDSGYKAQNAANQADAEKRLRIAQTTEAIDKAFDSPERQKQYSDYVSALRDYYAQDVGRQKEVADRGLKFSLARSGLTGGSASVDAGRTLRDEYNRGVIASENVAQKSLADLMSQDQQSRLGLIQMAQSGLDIGSAARNASEAMRANIAASQTGAQAKALGDLFGGTAEIYKKQQEAQQFRAGQKAPLGSVYATPFGGGR